MASACWAARLSHANTVASVTPSTKPMPARSTRTRSILRAIMTFSSEVRRSNKTVSRVAAQCVAHVRQRKRRRLPLWVREGARARAQLLVGGGLKLYLQQGLEGAVDP